MDRRSERFLPVIGGPGPGERPAPPPEPAGDAACPCCGNITIPGGGDALAYICPVCCWEIDPFLTSDQEPSDQNHGLTLAQARAHYRACGACLPRLLPHCRPPRPGERPQNIDQREDL